MVKCELLNIYLVMWTACWKGWTKGDTAGSRSCHGVWIAGC